MVWARHVVFVWVLCAGIAGGKRGIFRRIPKQDLFDFCIETKYNIFHS